eukprot:scaffold3978_cov291-Pinguiococcus_pyrenoidosus.AAC.8
MKALSRLFFKPGSVGPWCPSNGLAPLLQPCEAKSPTFWGHWRTKRSGQTIALGRRRKSSPRPSAEGQKLRVSNAWQLSSTWTALSPGDQTEATAHQQHDKPGAAQTDHHRRQSGPGSQAPLQKRPKPPQLRRQRRYQLTHHHGQEATMPTDPSFGNVTGAAGVLLSLAPSAARLGRALGMRGY